VALTIVIHTTDAAPGAPELALTFDSTRVAIGRSKSCDLWLPDPSVAKRHASIRREGGKMLVIDEGSVNGIVVDRVKLPAHAPRAIADGSLVRVGRVWLEIRQAGGIASPPAEVRRVAHALTKRDLDRNGEPSTAALEVLGGEGPTGERLALEDHGREYVLGRGRDADLTIADELASRRHVAVAWRGDGFSVRDLGSKQGSYLCEATEDANAPAETRLDGEPRLWRERAHLRIGNTTLRLVDPVAQAFEECLAAAELKMRAEEFREPAPGSNARGEAPIDASADPMAGNEADEDEDAGHLSPEEAALEADERGASNGQSTLATVDAVVALVALGLLALSVIGLFWLLR